MTDAPANSVAWIERYLGRLKPRQRQFVAEAFFEVHPGKLETVDLGSFFVFRLCLLILFVTIPTYLRIAYSLDGAYAPAAAEIAFQAWVGCAVVYWMVCSIGVLLHLTHRLNQSSSLGLTSICLLFETLLTSLYAYLFGFMGGIQHATPAFTVLILLYRLVFQYRFGALCFILACTSGTALVLAPRFGAPIAPILMEVPTAPPPSLAELAFLSVWYLAVFVGANTATNRIHKLRDELERAHSQLGELNQFITESVLKRYLPPALIEQIVKGEVSMDKPAEMRRITVLFSDLCGFTSTSEKLGPQAISKLLNDYLTTMNDIIFKYGGTIDKFIGDAIMVMFGAPADMPSKEQAALAIACAKDMQSAMEVIAEDWDLGGAEHLTMRIGIHQGDALVGNFGSDRRSDYTCIGPTVNLASRIESVCSPGEVYVSDEIRKMVPEAVMEDAGSFELRGLNEKQNLFRLGKTT